MTLKENVCHVVQIYADFRRFRSSRRDDAKIKKVHKLTVVVCYCSTDSKRREKCVNQRVKVTLRHTPVFLFPLSLDRWSKRVGCKTLSRVVNLRFIPVVSAVCLSFSRQLCATARGERETLLRKQVRAP